MAYLFDDSSSEYLQVDSTPVTTSPFVLSCWFNSDDASNNGVLVWIGDKDSEVEYQELRILSTSGSSSGQVRAFSRTSGGGSQAQSSNTYTNNTWNHIVGLFVASDDRRVLLNAAGKGTDSGDWSPSGLDRITIAGRGDSSPSEYFSGQIAEVAIWNLSNWTGATDSDKADLFETIVPGLAKGLSPLFYPLGLVGYYPLIRGINNRMAGHNLTAYNTPTVSPHPRIILPS
jgi:hypothetical protein